MSSQLWYDSIKKSLWYIPVFFILAAVGYLISGTIFLDVSLIAFPVVWVIIMFDEHSSLIYEHNTNTKGTTYDLPR